MKILSPPEQKIEKVKISSAFNNFCFDDQSFQNESLCAKSQAISKGWPSSLNSKYIHVLLPEKTRHVYNHYL